MTPQEKSRRIQLWKEVKKELKQDAAVGIYFWASDPKDLRQRIRMINSFIKELEEK